MERLDRHREISLWGPVGDARSCTSFAGLAVPQRMFRHRSRPGGGFGGAGPRWTGVTSVLSCLGTYCKATPAQWRPSPLPSGSSTREGTHRACSQPTSARGAGRVVVSTFDLLANLGSPANYRATNSQPIRCVQSMTPLPVVASAGARSGVTRGRSPQGTNIIYSQRRSTTHAAGVGATREGVPR